MLKFDNTDVNLHFGVHKTATTFLQENLVGLEVDSFQYTELEQFRGLRFSLGIAGYLQRLDPGRRVLISDENLIGNNGTILTGKLYPDFEKAVTTWLNHFENRKLVTVYLTIRVMTDFLPSQYCEHLRWHPYMPYEEYIAKANITTLSWYDVLFDGISANSDVRFEIYDFRNFSEYKESLLTQLSFGAVSSLNPCVKPSRASFTYEELDELRGGEYKSLKTGKFRPHSELERELSIKVYEADLRRLSLMPNVTVN